MSSALLAIAFMAGIGVGLVLFIAAVASLIDREPGK